MIFRWDARRLPFADGSVDLIFTDPPYGLEAVPLYWEVAREAWRVLREGGFLALMCGGLYLDKIITGIASVAPGLRYYWLYHLGMSGARGGQVWRHRMPISVRTKHVLVYGKGRAAARTATVSLYWAGGADKRWHRWGQDVDSHRYYIDCFSSPGDLVVDPMAGGGTTAEACRLLGRRWAVGDVEPEAVARMRARLQGMDDVDFPLFSALEEVAG